jgi:hypothetical protein
MADTRRPCPACGHLVFDLDDGWPGSYDICDVCWWEDDPVQFRWPFRRGGANGGSLFEWQQKLGDAGPSATDVPVDPHWRPIDPAVDEFEDHTDARQRPWPEDRSVLCWWLPTFWGRGEDSPTSTA